MKSYAKQAGMSTTGWICVVVIAVVVVQFGIKLFPVYMEDYLIKSSLEQLAKDDAFPNMTMREMRDALGKKMSVNDISQKDKGIRFTRSDDKILISSHYEKRISVFANIDMVITFDHLLDSSASQECC